MCHTPQRVVEKPPGGPHPLSVWLGVVPTAVLPVVLLSIWSRTVGYRFVPRLPGLAMPETLWSVLGHVVYALPVTVGHAVVARW